MFVKLFIILKFKLYNKCQKRFEIRVHELTNDQLNHIRAEIDSLKVEGDLRREVNLNIKRLIEIWSYRGMRHRRGLPTRGQNTKNNARTRKGPARTVAGKKNN